ncbi:hypothetical protein [Conexibacter sp. CPCC 206217]|uniref:hypothetical protein n=1 Tax=Conexibacter sp. CPCC 206217 TaxID=3064574 RepID=UPI00271579C7|nr:hypothetical protein [Conexibacter sp. CPCC 206217]MDO8210013.1 hypothetical protein [Conexibacter sp. CPCC 206217]
MSERPRQRLSQLLRAPWAPALAVACAILLVGAVAYWIPWLTDARQYVAATPAPTPSSPLVYAPVALPPGGELCMAPVTLPPDGRVLQLRTTTPQAQGPPLSVRVSGPGGYRASARLADGFSGDVIAFELAPPPRALSGGRVCVTNDGRRRVPLIGSTEVFTASARPAAVLDGRPLAQKVALAFYTTADNGLVHHLGALLDHAAAFKPFGGVLLGFVVVLLLLALPLATIGGLVWALRQDH